MADHSQGPRIGIFGLFGETTSFREPIPEAEYEWLTYAEDESLLATVYDSEAFIAPETRSFFEAFDAAGQWQPRVGLYAMSTSGPHLAEEHFQNLLAIAQRRLDAIGPLDGIYVTGHGSVVATRTLDTDAALLRLLRARVGPDVPIVMTLDLHGKLTPEMLELADLFIGYRTDPHVDMRERGMEAAGALQRMMRSGERPAVAHVRLPIMIPTAGIVAPDSPFVQGMADLVEAVGADGHASVLPGYPYTDTPYAGFCVMAAHWSDQKRAEKACRASAEFFWEKRSKFIPRLVGLERYAQLARETGDDPALPALCFADVGDNPGGGGTSNTSFALDALLKAGVSGAAIGPIHDPAAVEAARDAGPGATVSVVLNRDLDDPYALPYPVTGTVRALADGAFVARSGPAKGMTVHQGPTAAIDVEGVTIVLNTRALQALAVEQFEMVGIDFGSLRSVTVKSRGHYQASFSEFFERAQMIEIDAPGWTSPNLSIWPYRRIVHPLFPMDPDTSWSFDGFQYSRPPRRLAVR